MVLHDGSGLSLGGHIQFSGVPSLPPLREAGNICLTGLYPTVRLCPPVSSCLSVLRSSACFSLLLVSHKRPPEGTATITRNTKAGEATRGLTMNDRRAHAVTSTLLLFFSCPPFPLRFLFCLLSSFPFDGFLWHAERERVGNEVFFPERPARRE